MRLPAQTLVASLLFSLGGPLFATTVVVPTDRRLARSAELVVVAVVQEDLPPSLEGRPVTDTWVNVERVLKGELDGSALVVRSPGGAGADGMRLKYWGVPELVPGERVMLFLRRGEDGHFRILHTVLGAFRETTIDDRRVAFRDLSDVDVLSAADETEAGFLPNRIQRDFDAFADWVADDAAGVLRPMDYYFPSAESSRNSLLPMFTRLDANGRHLRWFDFDSNRAVGWRIDSDPLNGVPNAVSAFQNAIAAWNNETRTPIRLNYLGVSGLTAGFQTFDGNNVLLFEDPNDDVEGEFACPGGGTLAIGGPWYSENTTGRFKGETYVRIQGADIVLNTGLACYFNRSTNPTVAATELFGHELGHTLGLGHSSESATETNQTLRDALMYYRIHDDGRGASLRSDDLAGIRLLYDPATGGGGGGGGGTGNCPAGTLCLLNGRFQVTATWSNQFNGTSGAAGTIPNTDLSGFFYFNGPDNIELIVKTLDFGDRVLFFYGQLTNLRYTIRVLDTRNGQVKTYQNTPGDCGAMDNNLAASSGAFELDRAADLAPLANCSPSATRACLLGGRYALDVTWRNQFDGSSGNGRANRLSDLTAGFSFTNPANLELLVKTLEFPDRVLVLYGSLSNLEYHLRVTQMATGAVKTYDNAAGNYCGGLDNNAF